MQFQIKIKFWVAHLLETVKNNRLVRFFTRDSTSPKHTNYI